MSLLEGVASQQPQRPAPVHVLCEKVEVVADWVAMDFHVTAPIDHDTSCLDRALTALERVGFFVQEDIFADELVGEDSMRVHLNWKD